MRQHFYPGIERPPPTIPRFLIETELDYLPKLKHKKLWPIDDGYVPAVTVVVPPAPSTFIHENFVFNMEVLKKRRIRFDQDKQPSDIGTAGFSVPPLFLDHVTYSNLNPPPIHGELNTTDHFIGTYEPSNSSILLLPNQIYFIPIIIPYDVFIREIGIFITVPGTGTDAIRLGVYSIERGVVEQLLQENIANARTVGYRACELNLHVPAGAYALVLLTNSSILQVRKSQVNFSLLCSLIDDWSSPSTCWVQSSTFSFSTGFPDAPDNPQLSTEEVPRILVRLG